MGIDRAIFVIIVLILSRRSQVCKDVTILVYCITHISHYDLPEFPSAVLSSIDDATASPHSSALQIENSFCVILLKVNDTVHWE